MIGFVWWLPCQDKKQTSILAHQMTRTASTAWEKSSSPCACARFHSDMSGADPAAADDSAADELLRKQQAADAEYASQLQVDHLERKASCWLRAAY